MNNTKPFPSEIKKALQDFMVGYFFVFKVQLENAELVEKTLQRERPNNSLLTELAHGYISGSVTEFVLLLYDTVELLKKHEKSYNYKSGGSLEKIFKFRRHILAHRVCNWGSEESKETIDFASQGLIYHTCHEAAVEFMQDLQKFMAFEPLEKFPRIQKMRGIDLINLLRNSPALGFYSPVASLDEVKKFFGNNLLPKSN